MKFGQLEQVGSPEEVYYHPATAFVRDFLGKTFLLPGKVLGITDHQVDVEILQVGAAPLTVQRSKLPASANGLPGGGQLVRVAIRREATAVTGKAGGGHANPHEAN